jgi:ankyrin repeat protein
MKKTLFTIALAVATISTSVYAAETVTLNNEVENLTSITVQKSKVTPFCLAIAKGDVETVKSLIALGENVNKPSRDMTPAMYAARYNRVDIMKLLIKNGANIKKKNDKGFTAKKYAELSNAKDVLAVINTELAK